MVLLALNIQEFNYIFLGMLAVVLLLMMLVVVYGYRSYQLYRSEKAWRQLIENKVELAIREGFQQVADDPELIALVRLAVFRRLFLRVLIESSKKFSGKANVELIGLFHAFSLDELAWQSLRSKYGYKKVWGIEALTAMNEQTAIAEIRSLLSDKNPMVVAQAQYALVRFKEIQGLDFLKTLQSPISSWQQIRLLRAIVVVPSSAYGFIGELLSLANDSVVIFTLSIIRKFRILFFHDQLIPLLGHPSAAVAIAAVDTLRDIESFQTIDILEQSYSQQNDLQVRRAIVLAIKRLRSKSSISFLRQQLGAEPVALQLVIAQTLVALGDTLYLQELLNLDTQQTRPLSLVINHALASKL